MCLLWGITNLEAQFPSDEDEMMANPHEQTEKPKQTQDSGHGGNAPSELAVGSKDQLNQVKDALNRGSTVNPETLSQFPTTSIHDDTTDSSKHT
ncbi:MAG: hypothetical protein K2X29_11790, partial [Candidatus Obscuribacterales bacterium]|nr:hypothetical protein [Candidatus Obscuribacterales bacterium]